MNVKKLGLYKFYFLNGIVGMIAGFCKMKIFYKKSGLKQNGLLKFSFMNSFTSHNNAKTGRKRGDQR